MFAAKPVALVTGGAKGIGRAIARHLIASGWRVSVIDLPESGLRRAFAREHNVFAIEGDVRNEKSRPTPSTRLSIASAAWTRWSPMPEL